MEATDDEGRVRFVLPMGDELSEEARAAVDAYGVWKELEVGVELGPPPEPLVIKGVLRIDKARALAIDFVVPYGLEAAAVHGGEGRVEPMVVVGPSPRVRPADAAVE